MRPDTDLITRMLGNSLKLRAFIQKRTRNTHDAEDVYQETVLRMLAQSAKWPLQSPLQSPLAYACTVASHLIAGNKTKAQLISLEDTEELVCGEKSPEQSVVKQQELDNFYQALQAMPALRREVFIRRRLHGQSREKIATEMGLSIEAVKKHVQRGLISLHQAAADQTNKENS